MGLSLRITLERSGIDLAALAERERDLTPFHREVNALLLSKASQRLAEQIHGDIRTGNLLRSLLIGGEQNIYELGRNFGEVGTSVHYAAQVHFGGRIYPSPESGNKTLAVPITDYLKRYRFSPHDVDPGRERLRLIPREGAPPILMDPENEDFAWVLMPSVDWGPGYHYLEFREEDVAEIQGRFWEYLGLGKEGT